MLYQLREKLFSLGEDFVIQDDQGNDCYLATSKLFSLGEKLSLCDLSGQEVARIEQELLTLRPTYTIWRDGSEAATVTKRLGFLSEHFVVDVAESESLDVQGDPWNHEYTFMRADQEVARVSKQWFSLSERYGVEVQPNEDDVLILASAMVIDVINDKR
ncbi:MAG TPA: LURP-one-related family protein [Ktedonobacterales bacterium]|nr:LURP-one-related family protein [Ktedonobacterales bacterium]